MKAFNKKFLMTWWLALASLFMLSACGSDDDESNNGQTNQFVATLTGAQEVPPNQSTASGNGTAAVDPATNQLTATVTTTGIAGTDAHIHQGPPGVSGPIVFPLAETSPGSGVWTTTVTLNAGQLAELRAGNYYFNVHSAAFPNGEIRGQIVVQQLGGNSTTTSTAASTTSTSTPDTTTTSTAPGVTSTTVPGTTTTTPAVTTTTPAATSTTAGLATTSTAPVTTTTAAPATTTTAAPVTTTTAAPATTTTEAATTTTAAPATTTTAAETTTTVATTTTTTAAP